MWQVSTHSRPKAAGSLNQQTILFYKVSTHSRPKAAGVASGERAFHFAVSTHSRPKAAGHKFQLCMSPMTRFNTQPPEGGWAVVATRAAWGDLFQHTAARRRLGYFCSRVRYGLQFQHTAARRRLERLEREQLMVVWFQHTAARRRLASAFRILLFMRGGFNTQPPEGGWWPTMTTGTPTGVSTHSRPKAAGCMHISANAKPQGFQHTAARRRLGLQLRYKFIGHSFNTQPPEGGWGCNPFTLRHRD